MQQIKTTATFINAKKYDFQNDSNESVRGAFINVLLPKTSDAEKNLNLIGFDISKIKIPFDLFDSIRGTQSLEKLLLTCELSIGAKKVELSLVGFEKHKA